MSIHVVQPSNRKFPVWHTRVEGDAFPRLIITGEGELRQGDGTVYPDTTISGTIGNDGAPGSVIYSGEGHPDTQGDPGINGDYYIDITNGLLYGPKALSAWSPTPAVTLIGPTGPTGNTGATGAAGANGTNGTNGTNGLDGAVTGYYACKQTAQQIIGAATFADLAGLSFAIVADNDYVFKFSLVIQTSLFTTGPGFTFTAPAVSNSSWSVRCPRLDASADGLFEAFDDNLTATIQCLDMPVANQDYIVIIEGSFHATASGTLQLRGRAETANNVTFQEYSFGELRNITELIAAAGGGGGGGLTTEQVQDIVGAMMLAGTNMTSVVYDDGAATITFNAATQGGGGATADFDVGVRAYQTGGNSIAVDRDGTVISSLATTPGNNRTVLQAAIDACYGSNHVSGPAGGNANHAGGLALTISDQEWEVNGTLNVLGQMAGIYGHVGLNRYGLVGYNVSFNGTCLTASNFAGPILQIGATKSGVSPKSLSNPHGIMIEGIGFNGDDGTASQYGIRIFDTAQVHVFNCKFANFTGTGAVSLKLESTLAPDEGSLGAEFHENYFHTSAKHIQISGTGSTDGRITGGRVLGQTVCGIEIGASGGGGGWQVSDIHFTTGSDAFHIDLGGSPCMISGNYFDTTGTGTAGDNYHIRVASGNANIVGNHFKCSGSGGPRAPIQLTGTGKKVSIMNNTNLTGSGTRGFVERDSDAFQYAIIGNICDNDGAAWVSTVVTSAGVAVANDAANGQWIDMNPQNSLS